MRFEQALAAMREGKTVRLPGLMVGILIQDGAICYEQSIRPADPAVQLLCEDLMAEDWEVAA